jgi:hypothetical protein
MSLYPIAASSDVDCNHIAGANCGLLSRLDFLVGPPVLDAPSNNDGTNSTQGAVHIIIFPLGGLN